MKLRACLKVSIYGFDMSHFGIMRRILLWASSLVQLWTVAVEICGKMADRGVASSDGTAMNILMLLP